MREIKFRAFHKPSKKIFDIYCFTEQELREDCDLLQYTCLKDCEGKEIYEGHIVEVIFNEYYNNEQFTIDPETEPVKILGKIILDNFAYQVEFQDKTSIFLNEIDFDKIEIKILGNIYLNPELLELK